GLLRGARRGTDRDRQPRSANVPQLAATLRPRHVIGGLHPRPRPELQGLVPEDRGTRRAVRLPVLRRRAEAVGGAHEGARSGAERHRRLRRQQQPLRRTGGDECLDAGGTGHTAAGEGARDAVEGVPGGAVAPDLAQDPERQENEEEPHAHRCHLPPTKIPERRVRTRNHSGANLRRCGPVGEIWSLRRRELRTGAAVSVVSWAALVILLVAVAACRFPDYL